MRVHVEVGGRVRAVTLERREDSVVATIDDTPMELDVVVLGRGRYSLRALATGRQHDVRLTASGTHAFDVAVDGVTLTATRRPGAHAARRGVTDGDGPARLVAPMPGKVVRVLVAPGDEVVARQGLVVVEAMKMENELRAGRAGRVSQVLVSEGASIEAGALLVVLE
jgi:biotin carboxyl carrier protein